MPVHAWLGISKLAPKIHILHYVQFRENVRRLLLCRLLRGEAMFNLKKMAIGLAAHHFFVMEVPL